MTRGLGAPLEGEDVLLEAVGVFYKNTTLDDGCLHLTHEVLTGHESWVILHTEHMGDRSSYTQETHEGQVILHTEHMRDRSFYTQST